MSAIQVTEPCWVASWKGDDRTEDKAGAGPHYDSAAAIPAGKDGLAAFHVGCGGVISLNAARNGPWFAKALASPKGAWPHRAPVLATCNKGGEDKHDDPAPSKECSCGVYATTSLDVISGYLTPAAPVMGVVELGGRVIPATNGYRAAYARVAAILLLDEALTEPHAVLRGLAAAYRVPAVVPMSADPADYREVVSTPSLAMEAEEYLRTTGGQGA